MRLVLALVIVLTVAVPTDAAAPPTLYAFGDSITSLAGNYAAALATDRGWGFQNLAVSGTTVIEQATIIYGTRVEPNNVYSFMIGTNDEARNGADLNRLELFRQIHLAEIAWLALPDKALAQTASVAGQWSNTPVYGGTVGRYSTTVGSSLTFQVSGATAYVGYTRQNARAGSFSLTIDGVLLGTFETKSSVRIGTDDWQWAPALIRVSQLGSGSHTVVLTVVNPDYVYIDWAAGSDSRKSQVCVANVIRRGDYSGGGSDANVGRYSEAIEQNVRLLAQDGLRVTMADAMSVVSPADLFDGIHPSSRGFNQIEAAFLLALK